MRLFSKTLSALILILGLAFGASGQERRSVRDFDFIRSTSPWMSSRNAAGLGSMPVERIAVAEGTFDKENGGLIDNASSEDSFKTGAMTESYLKVSERLFFHGKLSYSYFMGKDMGGSILMDPSYNPVNFYESVDTTRGVKNREMYRLEGGLAYSLGRKWSIGVNVNYESGDQAKLKDPRFLNTWMDLGLSAGTRFIASDAFSVGLSLEYRRTLESLKSNIYGTTDKKYFTFTDYGGFYGTRELLDDNNGMVSTGNTNPMFNSFYGASLQIETGRDVRTFHQLTYLRRDGYFGNPGSSKIMYTEHGGNILEYNGTAMFRKGDNIHRIGLDFRYEGLLNHENVYRLSTEVGEQTVVQYISQNEVLDRTDLSASLSYIGWLGVKDFRPDWEYGARADFFNTASLATIYPFYRSSSRISISADVYGKKNLLKGRNLFTLGFGACFLTGSGNPKTDGILASSSSSAPLSMDLYLYRDYEYRTSTHAGAELSFRYTRLFSDRAGGYIEISDKFKSLLKEPEYLNCRLRNILAITIGCTF
jgi:hypothetical protein